MKTEGEINEKIQELNKILLDETGSKAYAIREKMRILYWVIDEEIQE